MKNVYDKTRRVHGVHTKINEVVRRGKIFFIELTFLKTLQHEFAVSKLHFERK